MVSIPNILLTVAYAAVIALSIVSFCSRQLVVEAQPSPMLPDFRCKVTLFFHNRRTECPGMAVTNIRTPREEGFFECVSAWDKWIAAFILGVIGCVFTFFASLLSLAAAFIPPTTTTVRIRAWIIAGLSVAAFVFFMISWPLARANVTEDQCGRPLEGFVMSTHTRILRASFGYGHGCLIAAWAVSTVAMIMSLVIAVITRNPIPSAKADAEGEKNAPDFNSDELSRISSPSAPQVPAVYDVPATATGALAESP